MNKRGVAGRAFTLLVAVGIIALFIGGFLLAFSSPSEALRVKAEINGLKTTGQLRQIISMIGDDINNCAKSEKLVHDVYGQSATFVLFLDNKKVCGNEIDLPDAVLETVLPQYQGNIFSVRLEVKKS